MSWSLMEGSGILVIMIDDLQFKEADLFRVIKNNKYIQVHDFNAKYIWPCVLVFVTLTVTILKDHQNLTFGENGI